MIRLRLREQRQLARKTVVTSKGKRLWGPLHTDHVEEIPGKCHGLEILQKRLTPPQNLGRLPCSQLPWFEAAEARTL